MRREALELALYTFRYVPQVDSVVAFMPPAPGQPPTLTLFFRKSAFTRELRRPLTDTLPPTGLITTVGPDADQTPIIDAVMSRSVYGFHVTPLQTGGAILILARL